jgi:hypothetical protein
MINHASFCRDQAQLHQDRADATDLPNVRAVELAAALSWHKEADIAHRIAVRRRGAAATFLY